MRSAIERLYRSRDPRERERREGAQRMKKLATAVLCPITWVSPICAAAYRSIFIIYHVPVCWLQREGGHLFAIPDTTVLRWRCRRDLHGLSTRASIIARRREALIRIDARKSGELLARRRMWFLDGLRLRGIYGIEEIANRRPCRSLRRRAPMPGHGGATVEDTDVWGEPSLAYLERCRRQGQRRTSIHDGKKQRNDGQGREHDVQSNAEFQIQSLSFSGRNAG